MQNTSLDLFPDFFDKGPAACTSPEVDPDIFFTDPKEDSYLKDTNRAKAYCGICVYKSECLTWALESDEIGVWGGTTETDRRKIKRSYRSSLYR